MQCNSEAVLDILVQHPVAQGVQRLPAQGLQSQAAQYVPKVQPTRAGDGGDEVWRLIGSQRRANARGSLMSCLASCCPPWARCAQLLSHQRLWFRSWEHRLPFLRTPACRDWQPCHRCLLGESSTVSPTIQQGEIKHAKINLSAVLDWECWLRPEPDGCLCAEGRRPICCCKRARKQ